MSILLHRFPQPSPPPFAASLLSRKNKLPNVAPTLALLHGSCSRFAINCVPADPLRIFASAVSLKKLQRPRRGAVCYAMPLNAQTLQWVSAVSTAILMIIKGTPIQKSFLVPLFALQAPASIFSWIKGEYGIWTAFLTLLVRLFYFIPGELDLPFLTMLLVIVAPYQATTLRGTQSGAIVSLAIAGFLAFQHFSKMGNLQRAFNQGSLIATSAIVCNAVVPLLFLL